MMCVRRVRYTTYVIMCAYRWLGVCVNDVSEYVSTYHVYTVSVSV